METISYIDRATLQTKTENVPGEGMLKWLYHSTTGNIALHLLLKRKIVSVLGGWFMDSRFSSRRIQKFVDQHQIDLTECQISDPKQFRTFNNFFCRKLKDGVRQLGEHVVSPADGKILAFQSIKDVSSFFVKGSEFTLNTFLHDEKLAKKYQNGAMVIIRLAPADYHRFHFPAKGTISESIRIKGKYFSVSPLALTGSLKIFCENYRQYSILETEEFGNIILSDVGATMVGSIIQTYSANSKVEKGDEKGYFAFGGSTLVLLFEKDKIIIDKDLILNTTNGFETSIKMGENIAS